MTNNAGSTILNAGTLSGATIGNAGTLTSTGTLVGAVTNTSALNASGTITGTVANNAGGLFTVTGTLGTGAFNNNAGSTLTTVAGSQTLTVGGAGLANAGTINLTNVGAGNALTMNGAYTGGGDLTSVVNLNSTGAGVGTTRAAQFAINGAATGTTMVTLTNVGGGLVSALAAPITVISGAGATATYTADATTAATLAPKGLFSYTFGALGGGNWGITQSFSGTSAISAGGQISGLIGSLNTSFFQSASGFVGGPSNPDANTISSGLWIRVSDGSNTIKGGSTSIVGGVSTPGSSRTIGDFKGYQVGADTGLFNIQNTGMNLHLGLTAGQVFANTHDAIAAAQGGASTSTATIPFYGAYAALTGHGLSADLSVRRDKFNMTLNNVMSSVQLLQNQAEGGSATTVAGSVAYRFDFADNVLLEPSAGLIVSRANADAVTFNGGFGTVAFNTIHSTLGRFGGRVAQTYQFGSLVVQPFATASVWHEFAGDSAALYTQGGVNGSITNTRVGTFAQFGLGTSGQVLNTGLVGFVRADLRAGENIHGYGFTGGLRYQF